jgi:hypothetical protein
MALLLAHGLDAATIAKAAFASHPAMNGAEDS